MSPSCPGMLAGRPTGPGVISFIERWSPIGFLEFVLYALFIGIVITLAQYAPFIPQQIKTVILWAGVVIIVLIFLQAIGLFSRDIPIPRVF